MNYQNGKIYKIVSSQTDSVYIGSSCKKRLCMRLSNHKYDYKRFLNGKYGNVSSFEILKYNDARIFLVEYYPCDTKDELYQREQYYIDNTPNAVNKYKAYVTQTRKEYYKIYRERNKERIAKRYKQKYTCICGCTTVKHNKRNHEKTQKHLRYITIIQEIHDMINESNRLDVWGLEIDQHYKNILSKRYP